MKKLKRIGLLVVGILLTLAFWQSPPIAYCARSAGEFWPSVWNILWLVRDGAIILLATRSITNYFNRRETSMDSVFASNFALGLYSLLLYYMWFDSHGIEQFTKVELRVALYVTFALYIIISLVLPGRNWFVKQNVKLEETERKLEAAEKKLNPDTEEKDDPYGWV